MIGNWNYGTGRRKSSVARVFIKRGEGQIVVNGRNVASIPPAKIPYLRRTIGVVFQDFRLIERKTIFENVVYLPRVLGFDSKDQKQMAYQALRRVEDGSYGYCEETGEPIGLARLEARPTATLSLEAQERHERRERVHRDD